MSPADELRTAAKTLREKTAAAREEMRTSFYWGHGEVTFADGINNACGGATGELAALFSPDAAEPLAAWLEAVADGWAKALALYPAPAGRFADHPALAVARAIAGSAS